MEGEGVRGSKSARARINTLALKSTHSYSGNQTNIVTHIRSQTNKNRELGLIDRGEAALQVIIK